MYWIKAPVYRCFNPVQVHWLRQEHPGTPVSPTTTCTFSSPAMHLSLLPPEVLEQVLAWVDLPSTLALSSSLPLVQELLGGGVLWRALLTRSTLNSSTLCLLTTFLATLEEREELEEVLVEAICSQHPHSSTTTGRGSLKITIVMPKTKASLGSTHQTTKTTTTKTTIIETSLTETATNTGRTSTISSMGVLLLHQLVEELGTRVGAITRVEASVHPGPGLSGPLLSCLSSLVEAQAWPLQILDTGDITCSTVEEAVACVALLGRCREWRVVGNLRLPEMEERRAGEVWRALAGAAGRGRCYQLVLPYSLLQVGEEGEEVWRRGTQFAWVLRGSQGVRWVFRVGLQEGAFLPRVEEGWGELEELGSREVVDTHWIPTGGGATGENTQ